MSFISNISTAVPEYAYTQQELLNFVMHKCNGDTDFNRKLSLIYSNGKILNRYSCLPYFADINANLLGTMAIEDRMALYYKHAMPLCLKAIRKLTFNISEITHLITVSCTGMSAPGLDIALVAELGLNNNTERTSVNFMGCYAAIHGLKLANAIAKSEKNAKVLVVCVELCTLHFRYDADLEQATAGSLFGDGCAAVLIESEASKESRLQINGFYSEIAFNGLNDMTWHIHSTGFILGLSEYVPKLLAEPIIPFFTKALNKVKIKKINHFGLHPGGRKILEYLGTSLKLTPLDLAASYKILKDYGNMSSPTVLFVLKEVLENCKPNETIFSAAFGPGLSMESMITTHV